MLDQPKRWLVLLLVTACSHNNTVVFHQDTGVATPKENQYIEGPIYILKKVGGSCVVDETFFEVCPWQTGYATGMTFKLQGRYYYWPTWDGPSPRRRDLWGDDFYDWMKGHRIQPVSTPIFSKKTSF